MGNIEEQQKSLSDGDLLSKDFEFHLQGFCKHLKGLEIRNVYFESNKRFRHELEFYLQQNFGKIETYMEVTPETPIGEMASNDFVCTVFGIRFGFKNYGQ